MGKAEKFFLRGMASKNLKDDVAAFEDFGRVIELDTNHVDAYFERGKLLKRHGRILSAIKHFGRVIELAPNYAHAYLERGKCFAQMKKFKAAIKNFSKVIELFPDPLDDDFDRAILSAEAFYRRAKVHEQSGNFDAAAADHFQSMSNYVASMMFYMTADDVTELIFGNEKPSETPKEDVIAGDWQWFAAAALGHGKCSYELGEIENALNDFDSIIANVPDIENFFDMKIYTGSNEVLIEQLQKYFEGIFDKNKAAEFNPNRTLLALTYIGRGQCYRELGNEAEAQVNFDKARELGFNAENFDELKKILDV